MRTRTARIAALTLAAALGLTACGGAEDVEDKPTTKDTSSSAPSETPSETPAETPEAPSATGLKVPAWAEAVATKGEKLGTIKADGFTVDVYQVAKGKAEEDSMFVDPKTSKNIMPKGSPVVFVNYVVTNTGSAELPLGSSLVGIDAKYADWPYMQGMPGEAHSDPFEALGLTNRGKKIGEDKPYVLGAGESFNLAESYVFQGPKELKLEFTLTPLDAEGDLDHDKKLEAEGSVNIK